MHRTSRTSSTLLTTLAALGLSACVEDPKTDPSDPGIATVTITATSTASATDSTSSGGDETSDTEGASASSSTGGDGICEEDADCPEDQRCKDGVCQFKCGDAQVNVPVISPNVMLVLDKSGSMVANSWDGDADPQTPDVTRWYSLFNVVEFVATDFDNSMNLGMTLFPSKKAKSEYSANACLVEASPDVPVGASNGATVLASLPPESASSAQIAGGTPTRAGVLTAIDHLAAIDDGHPKYLILVTDGAANCSLEAADETQRFEVYDEALAPVLAEAAAAGIATFVVGIDIQDQTSETKQDGNPDATNTFQKLNELAIAGGKAREGDEKFYNSQNQIELQAALEAIVTDVISCDVILDPAPDFPSYVEITIDGFDYGSTMVTDCESEDGWMYSSPEMDTLRLCGKACADFQMSGALDAVYGCPESP
ncbi:MAG: VWA domain-containing protein [Myxococcales bacterium]|nr:VWA domain-containing protein [Myxococcales bacterium]